MDIVLIVTRSFHCHCLMDIVLIVMRSFHCHCLTAHTQQYVTVAAASVCLSVCYGCMFRPSVVVTVVAYR